MKNVKPGAKKEPLGAKPVTFRRPPKPAKFQRNAISLEKLSSKKLDLPGAKPRPAQSTLALNRVKEEKAMNGPKSAPATPQKSQKPTNGVVTPKPKLKVVPPPPVIRNAIRKTTPDVEALMREKQQLEMRVAELVTSAENRTAEIATLRMEVNRLRAERRHEDADDTDAVEALRAENRMLKEKLVEMGVRLDSGAISDAEKELLLRHKCSSAPPSVFGLDSFLQSNLDRDCSSEYGDFGALNGLRLGCAGNCNVSQPNGNLANANNGSCEWDKQSASSLSEMSVACLQDRIMQMEENHYSTNEELQATLQELSDLQDQLTDLQVEVETLNNEKRVIFDSLYSQTEKLEDCRQQNNNLKQLLFSKAQDPAFCQSDREQRLLDLIRAAQEEKEMLLLKQEDLSAQASQARDMKSEAQREAALIRDRLKLVETTVESQQVDQRRFEKQSADLREQLNREQCETTRLSSLVEASKLRILELEDAIASTRRFGNSDDASEVQDLLESARDERDKANGQVLRLEEQVSAANRELARLRDHIVVLQNEALSTKKQSRKELGDVEFKLEQVMKEKQGMAEEIRLLHERLTEAEQTAQRHLEDKRDLKASLSDAQRRLQEAAQELSESQRRLQRVDERHRVETQEWEQFQQDLLMTVRVANDFKAEAQSNLEKLLQENRSLRDKIRSMELEIDRIRSDKSLGATVSPLQTLRPVGSPFGDLHLGLDVRRSGATANSRTFGRSSGEHRLSVRSLITSIESATKHAKANVLEEKPVATSPAVTSSVETDAALPLPPVTPPPAELQLPSFRPVLSPARKVSFSSDTPTSPNPKPGILTKSKMETEPLKHRPLLHDVPGSALIQSGDPLANLARNGGSKRNALLKWCQQKTMGYSGIDLTNFSSSWNDGLAFCALLHSYMPERIGDYDALLKGGNKKTNFATAFKAAESVGIETTLDLNEMVSFERPDWHAVMSYVTAIYKHFET